MQLVFQDLESIGNLSTLDLEYDAFDDLIVLDRNLDGGVEVLGQDGLGLR